MKLSFLCCRLFLDRVLVGHVIRTALVVDEFECQLICIGFNSCKSFNVHASSIAKHVK